MKGWTDIKALENTGSIKNEGLYLCASTLRRQVAFFLHLYPFGILVTRLCAAVGEAELGLISDFCIRHRQQPACMKIFFLCPVKKNSFTESGYSILF